METAYGGFNTGHTIAHGGLYYTKIPPETIQVNSIGRSEKNPISNIVVDYSPHSDACKGCR